MKGERLSDNRFKVFISNREMIFFQACMKEATPVQLYAMLLMKYYMPGNMESSMINKNLFLYFTGVIALISIGVNMFSNCTVQARLR